MKKYFAQLRPLERRLAIGVLVVVLLVLNWVFIWPHFSDWGNLKARQNKARASLQLYQTTIAQSANYDALVKKFAGQGEFVAPEDQAIDFIRTISTQGATSGVNPSSYSPPRTMASDAFFVEKAVNISVAATDSQLVDFLYKLGSGVSMVRVLDLELRPDEPHQKLVAGITLVASYQKSATANNLKPATAKAK